MVVLTVFLLVILSSFVSAGEDYCVEELCDGTPHIACNNTGKFAPKCPPNVKLIEMSDEYKKLSIDLHNKYRNEVATGKVPGYKKAARMATLVWDEILAKLAELNAKTCVFAHDTCRNTAKFLYAGQNIGQISGKTKHLSPKVVIEKVIEGWFNEHKDANMSYCERFRHAPNGVKIGHYTQLIRDEAYAMGCAMTQFEKDGKWITLYTCDYTLSNIDDYPIYEASDKTACKCLTKTDKKYPGLCSTDEIYDNELFYDPFA